MRKSNCTNGVEQNRGMGYQKSSEKEREFSSDKVCEKYCSSDTNGLS